MPDLTETLFAKVKDLADSGSEDDSNAPIIEVDAPAWALREDAGRDYVASGWGVALLVAACALMAALAGLLVFAVNSSSADSTIRDTLAIAFAANIALLALLGRSVLSKSDPRALLRIAVRRHAPAKTHDLAAEIAAVLGAATGAPAPAAPALPATAPAAPPAGSAAAPPAAPTSANPASTLSSFISREPVIVQGLVLVAGSLALAFGTDLGGAEVGGVAAVAAAALTALTRTATTSVAEPKGAAGEPLTAAPTAAPGADGAAPAGTTAAVAG